jgi:pimeloyl-ACP methyl ester carboxylesterase
MLRPVTAGDGRTLTVREGGDPNGAPVLAQNGTPGSSVLYEPHRRDAEAKGIRLFSYDRPGYGGSSRHEGRTVADCAADIEAVCDALGVDRFCTWGISGGGPHALATAALLPDRVVAAAALASVAPFDAEGLDFYEGMGEQNVEDFGAAVEGGAAHRATAERGREQMLAATPEELVAVFSTLLGPADVDVLDGAVAAFVLENARAGQIRPLRPRRLAVGADPGCRVPTDTGRRPPDAVRAPRARGACVAAGALRRLVTACGGPRATA